MSRLLLSKFVLLAMSTSLLASPAFAATPDGLVTTKAKLALWTTAGIKSGAVHVDTVDGVVTLYGKVGSTDQRTRAERATRAVGGVRDVTNRLQVVGAAELEKVTQADKMTLSAVEKALSTDIALKDSSIRVKSVDRGVVLLGGTAKTLSDHLRAILVADRVSGVTRVASEIEGPQGFSRDEQLALPNSPNREARTSAQDLSTSTGVKLRLLTAAEVPSADISVDTNDGVVVLFGIVPTAAVRRAAGDEASRVNGVVHVENLLEVVASNQKANVIAKDEDIAKDLSLAMKGRPEFKRVAPVVKNGVVQLTGFVESGWDEVAMARLARRVSGVRVVEDQLRIDEPRN